MARRVAFWLSLAVGAVVWGCGGTSTQPPTPKATTVEATPTTTSLDAIGATSQLSATVKDQNGQAMAGQTVTWVSDNTSAVTVTSAGLATATGNGTAHITAKSGSLTSNKVTITVAQVVTQLAKTAGDNQTGTVGAALQTALAVQLQDRNGHPVPGGTGGAIANSVVTFAVTQGAGAVSAESVNVGSDGKAATTWTLGDTAGAAQAVQAATAGGAASTTFTATAVAGAADSLALVSGDGQTGSVGAPLADSIVVRVADQYGNAVLGTPVAFSVNAGSGSVSATTVRTGADGQAASLWTLGASAGAQSAQAAVTGLNGSPVTFNATAVTVTIAINAGDNQTGLVGYALNVPPAVLVEDVSSNPAPGQTVTFAVTGGGGSVTGSSAVTDANGIATVGSWIMGGTAGANTMSATLASSPGSVSFSATGANQAYNIDVRFLGTPSTDFQTAFNNAAAKWETIIYGDVSDQPVTLSTDACGTGNNPAINETIDDVVIFARADSIDGPSGVLGQGGPCVIRGQTGTDAKLTVVGIMKFDTADVASMVADGTLGDVVLHEMGHVLGVGTLWPDTLQAASGGNPAILGFGLLQGSVASGGTDPFFNGAHGLAAFSALGGGSYTGGNIVPVENVGGPGSIDSHWRESVFGTELMTSVISPAGTPNPLSILTVGSLWDEGYTVNLAGADPYTQVFTTPPPAGPPGGRPLIHLGDDIWRGPLYTVDASGRVTPVRRP